MSTQVQIRLHTKQSRFAVPDCPFSVPSNVGIAELSSLVNSLLADVNKGIDDWESIEFDFLIGAEFLRHPLERHLDQKDISTEIIVDVEYIEKCPAPAPEDSLNHDDWVCAVHASENWFITGCYDNTIQIWSRDGTKILTIPGHEGPVKKIRWMKHDGPISIFASGSHDQNAMIWSWNSELNSVECMSVCRGHRRSVECLAINNDQTKMVTGSFDKMLHFWSTLPGEKGASMEECQQVRKKLKAENGNAYINKAPIMTLPGHTEGISAVEWTDTEEICTASWDHTIRIWNVELGGLKDQMVGNKSFFDMSYSPLCRLLVSASADPHVRLWDPRAKGGCTLKCACTSHTGWVTCVKWSATHEHQFISGSQDSKLKQWDVRSPKVPLYDLSGHRGNIMCCDWSNPQYILSGGADNQLRIFGCH